MSGETAEMNHIEVQARKYDGRVHRRWRARLLEETDNLIVLDAEFDTEVRHPLLGIIPVGTKSLEYYWTDRWYSVFRFSDASGNLRNYYCNINQPALFADDVLSFIDLDIDVLVRPDFSFDVLDEDEFETHALSFAYPSELRRQVYDALDELLRLIRERRFPFTPYT